MRVLLARRLDEPLPASDAVGLEEHLKGCPACRGTAHDYAAQRDQLRALATPPPPRDLWARTSTALDHEVTHGRRRPATVVLGSMASLGVVLALVAAQAGLIPTLGPKGAVAATPIAVLPQPVAYITRQGNEITIYQEQVSEICPAPAFDCTSRPADATPLMRVDSSDEPSDLALGPDGRLVITGRDSEGHVTYSVLELPATSEASASPSGPQTSGSPGHTPSVTSTTHPSASPTPTATRSSGPSGSSAPSAVIIPPPSPSDAPTPAPAHATPILTGVSAAGAPAAWSPDGTMLAFSAMPADGTRGPDIYVWRPGEAVAHALTKDHRSWFASWAGGRILVSRVAASPVKGAAKSPPASASPTAAAPSIETVLIDPLDRSARTVKLADAWLPSVDPSGRFVIYYRGPLERDGAMLRSAEGKLVLADWRVLDPYAPAPSPSAAAPAASPAAAASGVSAPTGPAATAVPSAPAAGDTVAPVASAGSTAAATRSAPPNASSTPTAPPDGAAFAPLILATPGDRIADWLVRWSPDGSVYGLWVTRTPDSETCVLLVAPTSATGEVQPDLLPPTPALRAFSLGRAHAAWVAPTDSQDDELRLVTWGPTGNGGVRIRQVGTGTLAF
ncbi:MAG: zf-HC2 domain-containing protein [Candidatus Limnocylindrales bacterium]